MKFRNKIILILLIMGMVVVLVFTETLGSRSVPCPPHFMSPMEVCQPIALSGSLIWGNNPNGFQALQQLRTPNGYYILWNSTSGIYSYPSSTFTAYFNGTQVTIVGLKLIHKGPTPAWHITHPDTCKPPNCFLGNVIVEWITPTNTIIEILVIAIFVAAILGFLKLRSRWSLKQ